MNTSYRIRLAKEPFTFSAAHFITYDGDTCERLHGHNYHVVVELTGPLDENGYVRDFVATRNEVATLVAELDHRVLLPTEHPTIHVEEVETEGQPEVIARHGSQRWVFPREDCRLLPLKNTTAELLAHYLGTRIATFLAEEAESGLAEEGKSGPFTSLTIEVDECDGQVGICRLELS